VIFADRVHRFFRRLAEWYLEQPRPGPELPAHYEIVVTDFANANPNATRAQWKEFSITMIGAAYADGYWAREREEIDIDMAKPDVVATQLDPEWRNNPLDLEHPDEVVPETAVETKLTFSEDELARFSKR